MAREGNVLRIAALHLRHEGRDENLAVLERDRVILTLGSITECARLGSNREPLPESPSYSEPWILWRRLAAREPAFGRPEKFGASIDRTKWESFSVTLRDPGFFDFMEGFTGNATGTGGLVTFTQSNWLMSIVLFHQPHFRSQPKDAFVFWGYGLHPDRQGNFVSKCMAVCSGYEILQELAGHLRLGEQTEVLLGNAKVIPCMMPFITSQFMPRGSGDRPEVIPKAAANFAVIGQFCEIPDDVVFTMEYSVRSAMIAVNELTRNGRAPPPVRRTYRDPKVLLHAARALVRG